MARALLGLRVDESLWFGVSGEETAAPLRGALLRIPTDQGLVARSYDYGGRQKLYAKCPISPGPRVTSSGCRRPNAFTFTANLEALVAVMRAHASIRSRCCATTSSWSMRRPRTRLVGRTVPWPLPIEPTVVM